MIMTRGQFQKELVPGLNAILGNSYGEVTNEHLPLFEVENSVRAFEEEVLLSSLGTAPTKNEGEGVQFDSMQELWTARYTMETVALAYAITEEAMEDNLYDTFTKIRTKALGRAMANAKQIKAANVFNLGFSATRPGGDNAALFSASHPTFTAGNQTNTTTADISETALEAAVIAVTLTKDDRGVLIGATPVSLHIPPHLKFTVQKILKSQGSTTTEVNGSNGITNTNKTNALREMGVFPKGVFINHRFSDTNCWFIKTSVPNGTKMFVRKPLSSAVEGDFDTGNMRYKVRERYTFGFSDWRQWWGSTGS
jgi:hypothetical protein